MSSSSKGKGSVKTKFWNKHHNKWQKKAQEKAVREDGKKQIRKEPMNYNPHTQLEIESDWHEINNRKMNDKIKEEGDVLQITYQVGVQDGKEIMSEELSDLRDELNYYKGEILRLTDRNNQLNQAIAALNGEPTNSL